MAIRLLSSESISGSLTISGTLGLSGTTAQYVRGDGAFTAFPAIPPDPTGVYLPLAGGTLTGTLIGTSATFTGNVTAQGGTFTQAGGGVKILNNGTAGYNANLFFGKYDGTDGYTIGQGITANDGVFRFYNNGTASVPLAIADNNNATFAGDLTINSAGDAGSPILRLNNSSSSSFNHALEAINANLTAGETELLLFGKATNTRNSAYIGFNWNADNSDTNYVTIGHWGYNHLLKIFPTGNATFAGDITLGGNILLNGGVLYKNSGSIEIKAENIRIKGVTTNENLAGFNENGSVDLYYNNNLKFETTGTGVSVAGNGDFTGNININSTIPRINLTDLQQDDWAIINDNGEFKFQCTSGSGVALLLNTSNNATFAGTINSGTITSTGIVKAATAFQATAGDMTFFVNNVGEAMRIQQNTGNVGIGVTSPTNYKLEVNGTVKGDSFSVPGASARIFAPSGAVYNGQGGQTGYLIVKLPDNGASGINNMMTGVIRVFDYTYHESFDVHFAGYWYAGYNWTNTTAWIDSASYNDRNFTVSFGGMTGAAGAGTRPYIMIGEAASTWSYCKFSVINYEPGHSNYEAYKWDSGWDMNISVTNPGTTQVSVSNTQVNNWARVGQDVYYGSGTGNVGIGNTSPSSFNSLGGKQVVIGDGTQTNNLTLFSATTGGSVGYGHIAFADSNTSSSSAQYAGLIQYYHGNDSMQFYTDATPRLTILNSGNVGIGNTSPASKLHTGAIVEGSFLPYLSGTALSFNTSTNVITVHDSAALGTNTAAGLMLVNNNNSNNAPSPLIAFSARSTSNTYNQTYAAIWGEKDSTGADANWNTGSLIFATSTSTGPYERMRINPVGYVIIPGNVGIGVTGPSAKLHVMGTTGLPATSGTTFTGTMRLGVSGGYGTVMDFGAVGPSTGTQWIQVTDSSNQALHYPLLLQPNGGKVGIGVTGPSATLQVESVGGNGANGDSDYGILAKSSTAGQATIGAVNTGNGYANLNLGSNDNGLKFWHISKRTSTDAHRIEMYYNAGSFVSLYTFETNGTFTATGDIVAYSDKRLKSNIKTLDGSKVLKMRGVSFEKDGKKGSGVIAQELEKVAPELVHNELEYKGVAYGNLTGYLIEAIKELKQEIDELKKHKCNCKE